MADLFELKLTQAQYQATRNKGLARGANTYPSYKDVQDAKKEATPDGIKVKPKSVQVSMQHVLDHQIRRILKDKKLVSRIEQLAAIPGVKFKFYFKYGADGMSALSQMQSADAIGHGNLFASALITLNLVAEKGKGKKKTRAVIFSNPLPNSALSVVPLRWAWEKESTGIRFKNHRHEYFTTYPNCMNSNPNCTITNPNCMTTN